MKVDPVSADSAVEPLLPQAIRSVAGTVALWWLVYGRLTPWPRLWYAVPEEEHVVWFLLGAVGVMVAAVIAVVRRDGARTARTAGDLGVVAWLVLSVWSTRRGDHSGLWVLIVPVYLGIAAVMVGVVELAGVVTSRRPVTVP